MISEANVSEIGRIYKCQFCSKEFARKSWFIRHACAKKKKFEEKADIVVQKAFRLYIYWMREQRLIRKKLDPDIDTFLRSPLKKSFICLAIFTQEQGLVSAYTYVDWLIKNKINERYWCDDDPTKLDSYREWIGIHEDAADHATITAREISKWLLEKGDRTIEEFYANLTPARILSLVQQRKIRPWVLFTYDPIVSKWLDEDVYNPEVFYRINDMVNCAYWADKISEDPEGGDIVTHIMEQLWSISQT